MGGLQLAFKKFNAGIGILKSPWVGLTNYRFVMEDAAFFKALANTFIISGSKLIFVFPVSIVLALLINELRTGRYKQVMQTVFTFPHFLSWVIVASVMLGLLGSDGAINNIIFAITGDTANNISFLGNPRIFRPILYMTDAWKSAGWSSIIYLASISSIDVEQYEAAIIDGATRFRRMWHITLPGIKNTIIVLFILACGNMMDAGFDQIFNLNNAAVRDVSDILDTYIYRITFQTSADFGFSTAISLMKAVANFVLLIFADRMAKFAGETGLFA
jgi:putative aldouronate transport system permease protein